MKNRLISLTAITLLIYILFTNNGISEEYRAMVGIAIFISIIAHLEGKS